MKHTQGSSTPLGSSVKIESFLVIFDSYGVINISMYLDPSGVKALYKPIKSMHPDPRGVKAL